MRVKCIQRCFFASSWSSLCLPVAGGVAASSLVAIRISPFRRRYPIWTKLPTRWRRINRARGESDLPDAVQVVQLEGGSFGSSAYCTRVPRSVGWPGQPIGCRGEGHLDEPSGTDGPDIRLDKVTKRFADTTAVDGLTLSIERGAFYAMLGPSGCGKTTTLRMIGGFEDPTEGTVYLGGADVTDLPPYRRDVNTVFQSYALFPHLDVNRNVAFGLERRKIGRDEINKRVGDVLELTQLHGLGKRKPSQLSGGQQQRVALARALVNRPQGAAPRRAARRARPAPAQAAPDRAEADPEGGRHHVRARDARPGGGDDDGRHHRRDERRPDRAGGRRHRAVRAARHRVRGQLPRRLQPRGRQAREAATAASPSS